MEDKLLETMQSIEKGLKDIKDNKASKQEVIDLIAEKTTEDKELLKASSEMVEKTQATIAELAEQAEAMKKQVKLLSRNNYSALKDSHGGYRGIFGSPEEAKMFGLLVLAGAGKSCGKSAPAIKALEEMGVEPEWIDEKGFIIKDMTGGSLTGGAAVVRPDIMPGLIALQEHYGVYRRNATVYPMGSSSTTAPKLSSGLTVYVPGEGTAVTKSDPALHVISILAKTWLTLTAISLELDEDSAIAIGELVGGQVLQAFGNAEDLCGFLGDGTSTYYGHTGITGALREVDATIANIKSLVVAAGNAYSEITLANFESVVGTLPEYADDGRAQWYCHRYFYYTVMVKLALAAGGASATEIIQGAGERKKSYMGYPVEGTQVMPKAEANSQQCTFFGNLALGAYLGARGGVEIAESDQRYFDQGLLAIRGRQRVGITVHGTGDTTNAGPIISLITAAS